MPDATGFTFNSMCRSRSCLGSTALGESVFRHVPFAVFGNAMTSRMLGVLQRIADETIKPQRDTAVRRRAVFERYEHVTKPRLHQVGRNLEQFLEDGFLHVGLMNTNRAAAEFHAVHHDVIVLATNFLGVGLEQRDVVGHRLASRVRMRIQKLAYNDKIFRKSDSSACVTTK